MLHFILSPHHDGVEDCQHEGKMRTYDVCPGVQKHREWQTSNHDMDADVALTDTIVKRNGTIVVASPAWLSGPTSNLPPVVSPSLLDPFDTLCESPERLRQLLAHPSANSAGEPLFRIDQQINFVLFQSLHIEGGLVPLLTNKTLFHALSLLLALVANDYQPNCETMYYRGQVLKSLNLDLSHCDRDVPSLQTITAILLLISYEYRVQDSWTVPNTTATHIHGLQSIINQCNTLASGCNYARVRQIQRALFWQDIICSLATGRRRLLQFDNHDVFARLRADQMYRSYFVLPPGLVLHIDGWPVISCTVFEDLNAMCCLVDRIRRQKETSIHLPDNNMDIALASIPLMENLDDEGYPLCNSQANLEIRIVDLLSQTKRVGSQTQDDLIYRACLFAAYLCTYRISAGLWEGHFAPEKCVTEILGCMADFKKHMSPWNLAPDISFWLLHVAGGLTKSQHNRTQAAVLVQRYRSFYTTSCYNDWEVVEMKLKKYIWCEDAMKEPLYTFWQLCT